MKLLKKITQAFRTITPEDYLFNQRASNLAKPVNKASLKPLPLANQGDEDLTDEVQLVGITKKPEKISEYSPLIDEFQNIAYSGTELIFLQIDPS